MTFYEAAVEVLRSAGRPLHYKKITEIAIKRSLLSHVGKTPELTMGTRLSQEIRKDDGETVVVRTRPGVFALRTWTSRPEDRSGGNLKAKPPGPPGIADHIIVLEESHEAGEQSRKEETSDAGRGGSSRRNGGPSPSAEQGRSSRRRRYRRRSEPKIPKAAASSKSKPVDSPYSALEALELEASLEEDEHAHGEDSKELSGNRRAEQGGRGRSWKETPSFPVDTETGGGSSRSLAQQVETELAAGGSDGARSCAELAAVLAEKAEDSGGSKLAPDAGSLHATLVLDNRRRTDMGLRPRFSLHEGGRWGLSDWSLSSRWLEEERALLQAAERLTIETRRVVADLVGALEPVELERLVVALLTSTGFANVTVVRRGEGRVVFAADQALGIGDVTVAIMFCTDDVGADHVTSLRGSLHHYGASNGLIVSAAKVSDEAKEESRAANLPSVLLVDRDHLISLLVDSGVAVEPRSVTIPVPSASLFADLRSE